MTSRPVYRARTSWLGRALGPAILGLALAAGLAAARARLASSLEMSTPQVARFILVIVDQVSWAELVGGGGGNLERIAGAGVVGLTNAQTLAGLRSSPADGYLTIGAAERAVAGVAGDRAVLASEPQGNEDVSSARAGVAPRIGPDAVVVGGLGGALRARSDAAGAFQPGRLGDLAAVAGRRVAVVGSAAATPGDSSGRQAVWIAADGRGLVPYARMGSDLFLADRAFPGGWRTDFDALLGAVRSAPADLVVVETGDTARIRAQRESLSPERERRLIEQAVDRALAFVGRLRSLDPSAGVAIVAPSPAPEDRERGYFLTPLVLALPSAMAPRGGGLTVSFTTRTPGIVSLPDLAATALGWLEGATVSARGGRTAGRWLGGDPSTDWVAWLSRRDRLLRQVYDARPILVKGYVVLQIALLAWAAGSFVTRCRRPPRWCFLAMMLGPATLLGFPLWPLRDPLGAAGVWLALTFGLALAADRAARARGIPVEILLVWTGGLVAASVTLDALFGSPLARLSPLGPSPVAGARYYGIGNEYMGVLIGSAALAVRGRWRWAVAPFVVLLLADPLIGANLGGSLAAAAVVGVFASSSTRFDPRLSPALAQVGWTLATATAAVVWLVARDLPGPAAGHVATLAAAGPSLPAEAANIVTRKLLLNLRLIRYTIWTRVLLAALAAMLIVSARRGGRRSWPIGSAGFGQALRAVSWSAAVALLANDSGVVAAATLLIYGALPLLALGVAAVSERQGSGDPVSNIDP